MIYITGDTHGDWTSRLNMNSFPEQKEMTKDDYVIILGDFGIWDNSKSENYNLDWLNTRSFTTLFVDGNHSNFNILNNLSVEEWHGGNVSFIRDSIIHLKRGQVFEIEGKKLFAFGGASSHDIQDGILDPDNFKTKEEFKNTYKKWNENLKMFRVKGISWWKQELPSEEEIQNGIDNLKKHGNKVDYIITHSPYTSLLKQMDGGSGLYKSDILTDYLQTIKQTVDYKQWLFGHMHINQTYYWERATCIYEQIVRIL